MDVKWSTASEASSATWGWRLKSWPDQGNSLQIPRVRVFVLLGIKSVSFLFSIWLMKFMFWYCYVVILRFFIWQSWHVIVNMPGQWTTNWEKELLLSCCSAAESMHGILFLLIPFFMVTTIVSCHVFPQLLEKFCCPFSLQPAHSFCACSRAGYMTCLHSLCCMVLCGYCATVLT